MKTLFKILASVVCLSATAAYAQWNTQTVDNSGATGQFSSLAYDSQGRPHIAYYNSTGQRLMYAYWTGSGWNIQIVDANSGGYCSLALDGDDRPHISYTNTGYSRLAYAYHNGASWSIRTVDSYSGCYYTALALVYDHVSGSYIGHISYRRGDGLWYARHDPVAGTSVTERVEGVSAVGNYTSIAVTDDGKKYISYWDSDGKDLKLAYYDGTQWGSIIVDGNADVGEYTSLVLDASGKPHIAYYDRTYGNLKHATPSAMPVNSQE